LQVHTTTTKHHHYHPQAEASEVRRLLEEASAQVTAQAAELEAAGTAAEGQAAELAAAQKQLSSAIASLDAAQASTSEQSELISSLKVENTGALSDQGSGGWQCTQSV
jgi:peptidoglycan hydrolase CwlO-like protein